MKWREVLKAIPYSTSSTNLSEKHVALCGLKFSDDAIRVTTTVLNGARICDWIGLGAVNIGIINVFLL